MWFRCTCGPSSLGRVEVDVEVVVGVVLDRIVHGGALDHADHVAEVKVNELGNLVVVRKEFDEVRAVSLVDVDKGFVTDGVEEQVRDVDVDNAVAKEGGVGGQADSKN